MSSRKILLTLIIAILVSMLCLIGLNAQAQQEEESSTSKPIKILIDEMRGTKDSKMKSRLIQKLETQKPETNEDINAIINALDDEDLELQEVAARNVYAFKIKEAISKLLKKIEKIPTAKIDKMSQREEKEIRINSIASLALSEMKVKDALPIIIDKFHVVRMANIAMGLMRECLVLVQQTMVKMRFQLLKRRLKK